MKLTIITLALLMILALAGCERPAATTASPATQMSKSPTMTISFPGNTINVVYISKTDTYFHKADCPRLAEKRDAVIREDALAEGCKPCPYCNP